MRLAICSRMIKINSFRDLTVWQVSMDLADPLLSKGLVLIEPIGKMLHGLEESLEARLNANA